MTYIANRFLRGGRHKPMQENKPIVDLDFPELIKGASGAAVCTLQSILRSLGFLDSDTKNEFKSKTLNSVIYFQQTHKGPDGEWLTPDGVVGAKTWWALYHAGEPQHDYIIPNVPDGIEGVRKSVLACALAERIEGVAEDPDGSNWGDGVTKYLKPLGYPAPWCCFFYSWCIKQATREWPLGKAHGHVLTLWREAKKTGTAHFKDKYDPIPGDAFVMLYRNKSGRVTGAGHIGFVLSLSEDGKEFNTVEGNTGNRVKIGLRKKYSSSIEGFVNLWGDSPEFTRGLLDRENAQLLKSSLESTR